MSAIAGSQLIWYKSMCTQRCRPQHGVNADATVGDGSTSARGGPYAADDRVATVDSETAPTDFAALM